MKKTRVMLVDDHTVVREGYLSLLETEPNIEVIAEAADGQEALARLCQDMPDVMIVDINMPVMDGLELTRIALRRYPMLKILILSMHDDSSLVMRCINNGASGYITKSSASRVMFDAIRQIMAGEVYLEQEIAQAVAVSQLRGSKSQLSELSNSEYKLFNYLVQGETMKEISIRMSITPKTATNYKQRIMQKLNARSTADLVKIAINTGVLAQNIFPEAGIDGGAKKKAANAALTE